MEICSRFTGMERKDGAFLLHTDNANVKVCFVTDEIVRVRASFDHELAEESYVLMTTAWEDRIKLLPDAALYRSTRIHHTPDSYTKRELVGAGPPSILLRKTVRSLKSPTGAFIAPLRCANASLPHGRRNRLIMQTTKNRKFPPVGNSLLYISLLSVALIASFTSSAILNNLFAICNSRLLPTNQIVNYAGRVRPIQGRTLFLFCI